MSDLILGLAGVIQKEIDRLGSVAQNAANANTVGYKAVQEFAALAGVEAAAARPGAGPSAAPAPAATAMERLDSATYLRTQDGALRHTGRATDLALSGDAWFVVDTPDGPRLTRDGRFRVSAEGVLVTAQGWPVVGTEGALRLPAGDFSVDREGRVSAGGEALGKLALVAPQDARALQPDGQGLYRASGPLGAPAAYGVQQGVLEQSNVNLSADMVRMMEASRHIESVQRALAAYNEMLGTGIGQIGKD